MEVKNNDKTSTALIDAIIFKHSAQRGAVIPVLQEIQETYGHVPPSAIQRVASQLGVFASDIYGIVTFYTQFRLHPAGRNVIKVCHGTACHLGGAEKLTEAISQASGAADGKTSDDGDFTLERVACLGCCSLAPCVTINSEIQGRLTPEAVSKSVKKLKEEQSKAVA